MISTCNEFFIELEELDMGGLMKVVGVVVVEEMQMVVGMETVMFCFCSITSKLEGIY